MRIGALLFGFTDQIEAMFGSVSGTNPAKQLVWSLPLPGSAWSGVTTAGGE